MGEREVQPVVRHFLKLQGAAHLESEPAADQLGEWLASCQAFQDLARDDQLVLPGHKLPYTGLPLRLANGMLSSVWELPLPSSLVHTMSVLSSMVPVLPGSGVVESFSTR